MKTKKVNLNEFKSLIKQIIKEENDNPCWKGYQKFGTKMKNGKEVPNCIPINEEIDENKKNFSLVIDKQSNRYFLTKKDDNKYIVINEKTKEISEIEHNLAKQLFRIVGDATEIENNQMNNLIK